MEDNRITGHRRRHRQTNVIEDHSTATATTSTTTANNVARSFRRYRSIGDKEGEVEVEAMEAWNAFSEKFHQVQSILDRNRVLIQQVNDNHQSKIHENLTKNIELIQEINVNISKVVVLYSDLAVNFNSKVQHGSGNGEGSK